MNPNSTHPGKSGKAPFTPRTKALRLLRFRWQGIESIANPIQVTLHGYIADVEQIKTGFESAKLWWDLTLEETDPAVLTEDITSRIAETYLHDLGELQKVELVLREPEAKAYFHGIEDKEFEFALYYWASGNILDCKSLVNQQVQKALREAGIDFVMPLHVLMQEDKKSE